MDEPPPASGDEHQCHRIALQRCSRLLLNRRQGLVDDQKLWDEALGAVQLCEDLWPPADFAPKLVLVDASKGFYSLVIHSIGEKLRHLNLGRTYCDDEIVVAVARVCPNLQTMILEENSLVSDTAISELATRCPNLRFVKLRNAIRVGDEAISDLVKNCAELAFLGISYTRCGDDTMYAIMQYAEKLHTLYLNDLGVTEAALCELLRKRGAQFDTLGMASLDVVSERVIHEIAQSCPNLRRLDLSACEEGDMTEDLVDMLVLRLPRLEALVVAGIDEISDEYIVRLAEKVSVEQFWLAPPPELT
ncbi:hypothetical protein HDU87_007688 [Geranomyces variabilis]|uniref:Uncharacterized protein n=1 Tax=Geranomyces variabilis TaxID=109894 RepID=A0AAD5XPQ3_9FUNG|nr:hypothetical protein HDU87_007688 [Geranomyces variabilis]